MPRRSTGTSSLYGWFASADSAVFGRPVSSRPFVGTQLDLIGELEAAVLRIEREAHDPRIEERQQERAIDADRLGVRAAIGVRDELELAVAR